MIQAYTERELDTLALHGVDPQSAYGQALIRAARGQQPAPWWYRLFARLFPSRCREIPEADNPTWCDHRDPVLASDGVDVVVEYLRKHGTSECEGRCKQCGAPPRIVLRQFSIRKRRWYLQQFGCSEDPRFMHSHPARFMVVIGLWGKYSERRISGKPLLRRAPYVYTMDAGHVHHVQNPSSGHTSLFLMFWTQHDDPEGDKRYYGAPEIIRRPTWDGVPCGLPQPETRVRKWEDHTRRKVERI